MASKGTAARAASSVRELPAETPAPLRDASEQVAAAEPDRSAPPPWSQRLNVSLLLLVCAAAYFLLDLHLSWLANRWWLAGLAGSPSLFTFLTLVPRVLAWKRFSSSFLGGLFNATAEFLKRRAVIPYLAALTAVALPVTTIDYLLHARLAVLKIVPGPRLTDLLAETSRDTANTYEIMVTLGRKGGNKKVVWTEISRLFPHDASSIELGGQESWLRWRAKEDEKPANQEMENLAATTDILEYWRKSPVFLATPRFQKGDRIRLAFRCKGGERALFPPMSLTPEPAKLKVAVFEPTGPASSDFFRKANNCETISP